MNKLASLSRIDPQVKEKDLHCGIEELSLIKDIKGPKTSYEYLIKESYITKYHNIINILFTDIYNHEQTLSTKLKTNLLTLNVPHETIFYKNELENWGLKINDIPPIVNSIYLAYKTLYV